MMVKRIPPVPLPPLGKVAFAQRRSDEGSRAQRDGFELASGCAARKHHTMTLEIPRSILRRFAREQRANAAQAEAIIWRAVRNRRCEGGKFGRQVVLGNHIVDFFCFDRRLVVEIDGPES